MEGAGEASAKDRLVVVGGGIAGSLLAKSMQSVADVVLIDSYVSFRPMLPLVNFVKLNLRSESISLYTILRYMLSFFLSKLLV